MSQRDKRLAVVIGNSNYQDEGFTEISNAVKDAESMQKALSDLGFDVKFGINTERGEIIKLFTSVRDTLQKASEIVVYYSGHGISVNGKVYLCPVDALHISDFIDNNLFLMDHILGNLLKYRKSDKIPIIIILDCCRSVFETENMRSYNQGDPLRDVRENNSSQKINIAVLYSTAEGHAASDGCSDSGHSPYTEILLQNIIKDRTIEEIHSELLKFFGSSEKYRGKQIPWMYQCLYESYKFHLSKYIAEFPVATENDFVKEQFHGVPLRNSAFVNRPKMLKDMQAALNKNVSLGGVNILALRGLGGMGKTQLMLHYCYLCHTTYKFTFWLEVNDLKSALNSFRRLAVNLGLDEKSANEKCRNGTIMEWVCDWLKGKKEWLLLLNDVDDAVITKLFGILPRIGGDIILTTREYISLITANIIIVGKMDEDEALFLLLGAEKMKSIDCKSLLYAKAKEIVTKLDSMAFAINLARGYIEYMSISHENFLTAFRDQRDRLFSYQDEDNYQYSYSLKTVWELSFSRIRDQSSLAIELLEICSFLRPELIPVSLFKRQHSTLSSASNLEGPDAVQKALRMLKKFLFITRTLNEGINKADDPTNDTLTIHRLVQRVIYDEMGDEQRIRWTCNIASALNKEIDFSDSNSPLTQTMMNAYLSHIRHFAKVTMTNANQKEFMSEDLFKLIVDTVLYSLDNDIYFGVEELAQFALSISESIHELESYSMARSLNCLARLYFNQGNYGEAEPLYERALITYEKALGPNHPDTASSLNDLAELLFSKGNYGKAEILYKQALVIRKKALGPEHLETAMSLNNLARFYSNQENYDKAESLYKQVLAIKEKTLGLEHLETILTRKSLAQLCKDRIKSVIVHPRKFFYKNFLLVTTFLVILFIWVNFEIFCRDIYIIP